MHQQLQTIFKQREKIEPPQDLIEAIFLRLVVETQRLKIKRKIFFASIFLLISFGLLIFALRWAWINFADSGFFKFFSLVFSDFSSVLSLGETYLYSLLEILPVDPLILSVMILLIFLEILRYLIKNLTLNSQINFLNRHN